MGFFKHDQAKLEHPYVNYKRRGRPGARLERWIVTAAAQPLIDAVQRVIKSHVVDVLTKTEYLFCNYYLTMEEGVVTEQYIELCLCHNGPGRSIGGPVARIWLNPEHLGVVAWLKVWPGELVYQKVPDRPDEFKAAVEAAVGVLFGRCVEIPVP